MSMPSVLPAYRQFTVPLVMFPPETIGLITTGTREDVVPTELEAAVLAPDEIEEVGVGVAAAANNRSSNCPGCHIDGAHWFEARTVAVRQRAMAHEVRCLDQDVL